MAKVVPESCQRTDGIDAWLEIKTEKENKRMEKEVKQRDRKEIKNYFKFIYLDSFSSYFSVVVQCYLKLPRTLK